MKIRISRKTWLSISVSLGLVAVVWMVGTVLAQGDTERVMSPAGGSAGNTFTYQGRLLDGGEPATGTYDFEVTIWDGSNVTTNQVASCPGIVDDIPVVDGVFTLYLNPDRPMSEVFNGGERWIRIGVCPDGGGPYTDLGFQPLSPAPYAWGLRSGAVISGDVEGGTFGDAVLNVSARHPWGGGPYAVGIYARSSTSSAVWGESAGIGVYGQSTSVYGVKGHSTSSAGGYFSSDEGHGLRARTSGTDIYDHGGYFEAYQGYGIYAESTLNYAVRGEAGNATSAVKTGMIGVLGRGEDHGVVGSSDNGCGVYGYTDGTSWSLDAGVFGESSGQAPGVHGNNTAVTDTAPGVMGTSTNDAGGNFTGGLAGLYAKCTSSGSGYGGGFYNDTSTANSQFHATVWIENKSDGDLIWAAGGNDSDVDFRVTGAGHVYANGYHTPAADFAEMLPAEAGLEPGDVLVIGPDGQLTRATEPYATNVAGVYSTEPGFVGGNDEDLDPAENVPLAIVGIVPVKASAENGPIAPGDLLTTSSTPGHVMKAEPVLIDGVEFHRPGTLVGKALEPLDAGQGVIEILVTLQ